MPAISVKSLICRLWKTFFKNFFRENWGAREREIAGKVWVGQHVWRKCSLN
jgi:hypothetical protein